MWSPGTGRATHFNVTQSTHSSSWHGSWWTVYTTRWNKWGNPFLRRVHPSYLSQEGSFSVFLSPSCFPLSGHGPSIYDLGVISFVLPSPEPICHQAASALPQTKYQSIHAFLFHLGQSHYHFLPGGPEPHCNLSPYLFSISSPIQYALWDLRGLFERQIKSWHSPAKPHHKES